MIDRQTKDTAASVRQRLMNLREVRGHDFNAILSDYTVERFLYRLSKSPLSGQFVLKGAMLFRTWRGAWQRPTRDLDLLGRGESTPGAVMTAWRRVFATKVPDDGLVFDPRSVVATEIREGRNYGGIRSRFRAMLGSAVIPVQVDVGFGDAVTPAPTVRPYPTLLGMDAPRLWMYPPQAVVAEKIEAITVLGMTNSRMKDFYDLWVILGQREMNDDSLALAIAATFRRRGTSIPDGVPIGLSDAFALDESAARLWREFMRRLQLSDAPADLIEVVRLIRDRVGPILDRARRGQAK